MLGNRGVTHLLNICKDSAVWFRSTPTRTLNRMARNKRHIDKHSRADVGQSICLCGSFFGKVTCVRVGFLLLRDRRNGCGSDGVTDSCHHTQIGWIMAYHFRHIEKRKSFIVSYKCFLLGSFFFYKWYIRGQKYMCLFLQPLQNTIYFKAAGKQHGLT